MLKSYSFARIAKKIISNDKTLRVFLNLKGLRHLDLNSTTLKVKKNVFLFSSNKNSQDKDFNDQKSSISDKAQQNEQEYSQNAKMTEDGSQQPKNTPFVPSTFGNYFFGISIVALLLAYGLMEIQFMRADNKKKASLTGNAKVTSKGKAQIGGQWELTDTNGKPFSNKNLQGGYYLIYFGFTNCPDICPNSLMKLTKALEKVKKTKQSKFYNIETVFVSVDPDRDNPQKIKKFIEYFDKTMIGVSGKSNDDPVLKQCMKKFKIYSSKIEYEDEDTVVKGRKAYTIDHTILTYLMNPQNQYVCHIGANLSEHDIAKLILQKINQDQKQKVKKMKI